MSAFMIAVTNQKGGVGKTTTSAALLASLHNRGARVLGVDLDPQGSLGFSLGLDIGAPGGHFPYRDLRPAALQYSAGGSGAGV